MIPQISRLLTLGLFSLALNTQLQAENTITLNLSDRKQEIDGFGGCFIAYDQMPAYRDPTFYDLAVYDVGLSIIRAHFPDISTVNTNGESDPERYKKSEYGRMIFREFKKRGVETFFSSNWSPPAEFKTNQSNLHGGYLIPDKREAYGQWIVDNIRALEKQEGIRLKAVSLQNELMFIEPYDSGLYSPTQYRETFRAISKVFLDQNLDTQIIFPEDMGWYERTRQYIDAIMQDKETKELPGFFCSHGWSGDENWERMGTLVTEYGRKLWMTETSGHNQDWDGALALAADIHKVLALGNASGYIYWQLNARIPNRSAILIGGRHSPKSAAMKHYARYVRPGAERIYASSSADSLSVSAYRHAEDQTLSIAILNTSDQQVQTRLHIAGSDSKRTKFTQFTSDEQKRFESSVARIGKLITIPARSIVTLYGREDGKLELLPNLIPAGLTIDNNTPLATTQDTTTGQDEQLHYAARANDVAKIKSLLASDYDPNMRNVGGFTPLHRSAWPGHKEAISPLIKGGANPNATDSNGETPLHIASSNGHESYIRELVGLGADVDFPSIQKLQTPLHNACRGGNLEAVKLLIELGADVNKPDHKGWTALFFAGASHYPSTRTILDHLIKTGANPQHTDEQGKTALHVTASNLHSVAGHPPEKDADKLNVLINAGTPVNQADMLGKTALHYLAQISHWGYAETAGKTPQLNYENFALLYLLEQGADPSLLDQSGKTSADYAKLEGYKDYVRLLQEHDSKEDEAAEGSEAVNRELSRELLKATHDNDIDQVATLLEKGADPNFKEKQGGTSLHGAVQSGNQKMLMLLLRNGADINIRDSDGYLPVERAQQSGRSDLVLVLEKY